MRDKVVNWLKNGANAQDGVPLMEQAGANRLTLRIIRANPTANKRLMVEFLTKRYNITDDYTVAIRQPEYVVQKKTPRFREEFPFLNDPKCPIELQALASRKFGSYYSYIDLHKKLRDCTTLGECADVSRQLIDSYLDNRAIYAELEYFRKHRALLGKHPIFLEFARRKELLHMSIKELILRQQQIENNIWRVNSEIKKGNKPHLDAERRERIAGYEAELEEVKRLLE